MLAHSDLQRSIQQMVFGLSRRMAKKTDSTASYGQAERELQYQYDLSGAVGTLPAECKITISFDVMFLADAGNSRDSTLDRPQVRVGFEKGSGPIGLMLYAHVSEWTYDADFNFIGATVTAGAYLPPVQIGTLAKSNFTASLHIAFQGYGLPYDSDSAYQPGGNTTYEAGMGA